MRSLMFVPGHNADLLNKAKTSEADMLILDLEDSVPDRFKSKARQLIMGFESEKKFAIRINSIDDIDFIKHDIMVPKATIAEVARYSQFNIIALIESARGVMEAYDICKQKNVIAVAFGSEDYKADTMGRDISFARAMIANAAIANKIPAIDTVCTDSSNHVLTADCAIAIHYGFSGKLALSPRQVDIINRMFSYSQEDVDRAQEIINLYNAALKNNQGVAFIGNKFIGPPLVRWAKKVLNEL